METLDQGTNDDLPYDPHSAGTRTLVSVSGTKLRVDTCTYYPFSIPIDNSNPKLVKFVLSPNQILEIIVQGSNIDSQTDYLINGEPGLEEE